MRNTLKLLAAAVVSIGLAACGGGIGAGSVSNSLSGLAAVGAAIANGAVSAKCTAGPVINGTTDANGAFNLALTAAHTAPCMLQVTGGTPSVTLHSFATAAGQINITPLTDLIVTKALGSDPAAAFTSFDSTKGTTISGGLTAAKTYVQTQVTGIAGAYPTPDAMTGTFVVGDASDKVLDALGAALAATGTKTHADLRTAATTGATLTTTVPAYLGAPTNATAVAAGATSITVGWASVTGATGYNIYRSTSANVALIAGNKITATPVTTVGGYVDSGRTASTAYYYKVTATSTAVAESAASTEVFTTTNAATTTGTTGGTTGTATLPAGFTSRTNPSGIVLTVGGLVWSGTEFVGLEQSTDYHNSSAKFFVWKSTDGIAWSRSTTDLNSTFIQLSAANGKVFQMSGGTTSGTVSISSSTNGLNWTTSSASYVTGDGGAPSPIGVKYLNNKYFANLDVGTCMAITSSDGATWTSTNLKTLPLPTNYTKAINQTYCSEAFYVGGKYLIYGGVINDTVTSSANPTYKGLVYTSTDAITWAATAITLPTGANSLGQAGRLTNMVQVGSTIVFPTVMAQNSRRINPSDAFPTLVTDSAQVGTSTDGTTFTYANASGITYPTSTVGSPGLPLYFPSVEVSGLGLLGYHNSTQSYYWTLNGTSYSATQDFGLRSTATAANNYAAGYSSRYAYSPSLNRLVVVQFTTTGLSTPTIMTKDFTTTSSSSSSGSGVTFSIPLGGTGGITSIPNTIVTRAGGATTSWGTFADNFQLTLAGSNILNLGVTTGNNSVQAVVYPTCDLTTNECTNMGINFNRTAGTLSLTAVPLYYQTGGTGYGTSAGTVSGNLTFTPF